MLSRRSEHLGIQYFYCSRNMASEKKVEYVEHMKRSEKKEKQRKTAEGVLQAY